MVLAGSEMAEKGEKRVFSGAVKLRVMAVL